MSEVEQDGAHRAESEAGPVDLSGAVGRRIPESIAPNDAPDSAPADDDAEVTVEPTIVPYANPAPAPQVE